jgi:hypothetical protein
MLGLVCIGLGLGMRAAIKRQDEIRINETRVMSELLVKIITRLTASGKLVTLESLEQATKEFHPVRLEAKDPNRFGGYSYLGFERDLHENAGSGRYYYVRVELDYKDRPRGLQFRYVNEQGQYSDHLMKEISFP